MNMAQNMNIILLSPRQPSYERPALVNRMAFSSVCHAHRILERPTRLTKGCGPGGRDIQRTLAVVWALVWASAIKAKNVGVGKTVLKPAGKPCAGSR